MMKNEIQSSYLPWSDQAFVLGVFDHTITNPVTQLYDIFTSEIHEKQLKFVKGLEL